MPRKPKGDGNMPISEAGRRGGERCLEKHGIAHFRRIGKISGDAQAKKGPEHFRALNKLANEARAANKEMDW